MMLHSRIEASVLCCIVWDSVIQGQHTRWQKLILKNRKHSRKNLKRLKKMNNGEIDRILFQDESMIRDYQAITKSWFPKGQQKKIPTYGKHHGVKLIGTLDYKTGDIFCIERERYDAKEFLTFLEQVVNRYPNEKITMILDNARIH